MQSNIQFEKKARISDDGLEVVMSVEDFKNLIRYINELKDAVNKLNAEIEAYNKRFANDKDSRDK